MRFPHGSGFGMFGGILQDVIAGLFFIVCFLVVVGLLVVIVRFLLVATKAAELYIAKNSAATSVATTPSPEPTVATIPLASTAPSTPTTKTVAGNRASATKKTPPTV